MNVLNITLVIVIYSPEALAALGSTGVMVGDLHLTCLNNFVSTFLLVVMVWRRMRAGF